MTAPPAPPAYAGLISRGTALVLDALVLTIASAIAGGVIALVLSLFPGVAFDDPGAVVGTAAAWSVLIVGYFTCCWVLTGQTVGMRIMAVRVVRADGARIGFPRAIIRLALVFGGMLLLFVGWLLVLVDDRRRALHDVIAGTVVVYALAEPEPLVAAKSSVTGEVGSPGTTGRWLAP